jgi:hypothetical protein
MSKFYNKYEKYRENLMDLSEELEGGASSEEITSINTALDNLRDAKDAYNKKTSDKDLLEKLRLAKEAFNSENRRLSTTDPDRLTDMPNEMLRRKYNYPIPDNISLDRLIVMSPRPSPDEKLKIKEFVDEVCKQVVLDTDITIDDEVDNTVVREIVKIVRDALVRKVTSKLSEFELRYSRDRNNALNNNTKTRLIAVAKVAVKIVSDNLTVNIDTVDIPLRGINKDNLFKAINNARYYDKLNDEADVIVTNMGSPNPPVLDYKNLVYYTSYILIQTLTYLKAVNTGGMNPRALGIINDLFCNTGPRQNRAIARFDAEIIRVAAGGPTAPPPALLADDYLVYRILVPSIQFATKAAKFAANFILRDLRNAYKNLPPSGDSPSKPEAPEIKLTSSDATKTTVSWTKPVDGGTPITNYHVYKSLDNITWDPPNKLSNSILTLDIPGNTKYYIKVKAVNKVGESPDSNIVFNGYTGPWTLEAPAGYSGIWPPPFGTTPDLVNVPTDAPLMSTAGNIEEMLKQLTEAMVNSKDAFTYIRLLEDIFTNMKTYANMRTEEKDNFMSHARLCGRKVSGAQCLDLLHKCLSGDKDGCIDAWNMLDFSKGVDFKDADRGAVLKLAKHLGLDKKSVEDVVNDLENNSQKKLAETVKVVFKAIKKMVNPESVISYPEPRKIYRVSQRNTENILSGLVGGGHNMYGGGATGSYSNFIRSIDALKNNNSMVGGLGVMNVANMTRSTIHEFVSLLKNMGKQIDEEDLNTIREEINSLERTEKRLIQVIEYIQILNKAIKVSKLDLSSEIGNITLNLIEELAEKKKNSELSMGKKFTTISDLLSTLAEIVNDYNQNKKNGN